MEELHLFLVAFGGLFYCLWVMALCSSPENILAFVVISTYGVMMIGLVTHPILLGVLLVLPPICYGLHCYKKKRRLSEKDAMKKKAKYLFGEKYYVYYPPE